MMAVRTECVTVKTENVMGWYVQDEVNQEDSEQNSIGSQVGW